MLVNGSTWWARPGLNAEAVTGETGTGSAFAAIVTATQGNQVGLGVQWANRPIDAGIRVGGGSALLRALKAQKKSGKTKIC